MPDFGEETELPASVLHDTINRLIEAKLVVFKTELDMRLLPLELQLRSHDLQMDGIRTANAQGAMLIARMEGNAEAFRAEMREADKRNAYKLDRNYELYQVGVDTLNNHLGMHEGLKVAAHDLGSREEAKTKTIQGWARVGFGAVSFGGLFKLLRDWWTNHHHSH